VMFAFFLFPAHLVRYETTARSETIQLILIAAAATASTVPAAAAAANG